jgi:hypothetical protein
MREFASLFNRQVPSKEVGMSNCAVAQSEAAKKWPEGLVSAKLTMNPYLLAMAFEEAMKAGSQLWEFINTAVWEKLGEPDRDKLLEFAANMEVFDEDPKWKKRLKISARYEMGLEEFRKELADGQLPVATDSGGNGGPQSD